MLLASKQGSAQLSPGDLSTPHAALEGMGQCTSCHELGRKLNGQKCLDCHTEIRTRIAQNKGLHGFAAVRRQECSECHREHKGRDYRIIIWPGGKDNFDHAQTGFMLEGQHKKAKCESCHRAELIRESDILDRTKKGLSLSKTFLGLSSECKGCHFDEHRGQFTQKCTACHDNDNWKKSAQSKFDHADARFQLSGKHTQVACVQCHATVSDPQKMPDGKMDADFTRFKNIQFEQCSACHKDPHRSQFGTTCNKCHSTTGWINIKGGSFDHSNTHYPLTGKHRMVSCSACHQPDEKKKPVYKGLLHNACSDCHMDAHGGQFKRRADQGACEACHETSGFIPSTYTTEQHRSTKFSLTGSHNTVACNLCHVQMNKKEFELKTGMPFSSAASKANFIFLSADCKSCHTDVHKGQFKDIVDQKGCEACHLSDSWSTLAFDHNRDSKFPLQGKHKTISCFQCHPVAEKNAPLAEAKFRGISTLCSSCHVDIHYGQFILPGEKQTACDRCHNEESFKPSIFDHQQARFSLNGAHEKVACGLCHKTVKLANGSAAVVYRPIAIECAACHSNLK